MEAIDFGKKETTTETHTMIDKIVTKRLKEFGLIK